MGTAFALRPLGALDLDLAAGLHGEAFRALGERGWSWQDLAGLLASPGAGGFLLDDAGACVGLAICRIVLDEAELLTIAVRPAHRRTGAGRALLLAVVERARGSGAKQLFLEVGADNPAALALYAAAGFQPVGGRRAYYPRGQRPAADAIVMRLELA
jgi:[ribosomal protein S18]-alanine N-acetyltransferase